MNRESEMKLVRIIMNKNSDLQTIILKEIDGDRTLAIGIGNPEVNAIKIELAGIKPPRPLTHDLLKNVIDSLDATIKRIIVTDLEDSTFYAKIVIGFKNNSEREIDARPSDGIALALRAKVPIYAREKLLNEVSELDVE